MNKQFCRKVIRVSTCLTFMATQCGGLCLAADEAGKPAAGTSATGSSASGNSSDSENMSHAVTDLEHVGDQFAKVVGEWSLTLVKAMHKEFNQGMTSLENWLGKDKDKRQQ